MFLYLHHIGDYLKDTVHLSIIEDAIYRRLIDLYYLHEKPFTDDIPFLARQIRAREHEKEIEIVLNEFFTKTSKGWIQKRCNIEIKKYQAICERNRLNGQQGGRPRKTQSEPTGNPLVTKPETINHKPETREKIKTLKPLYEPNGSLSPQAENEQVEKSAKQNRIPYQKIVDLYHELLPMCPKVQLITTKRKGQISARWNSGSLGSLETWHEYFAYCSESRFLTGQVDPINGHNRFIADIEWLTNETNFTKVWEGKYHGKRV